MPFSVAPLLHQSSCLVNFSWIAFVFRLLPAGVTVLKEMHLKGEKVGGRETGLKCCCFVCFVPSLVGTEADILWALNCRRKRQTHTALQDREKKDRWGIGKGGRRADLTSFCYWRVDAEAARLICLSLLSIQFLQSFAAVELFIAGSVCVGEGKVCVLRVLDFRSVQEGLRVERLTNWATADAGFLCVSRSQMLYAFYIRMPL